MASGVFGLRKVYKKQLKNIDNNNFESWMELTESNDYGYLMGGRVNAPFASPPFFYDVSNTQRIDYSSSTLSSPPLRTPVPISRASGVSNKLYGYFAGGFSSPPTQTYSTITRLDFSTESKSDPGNNFSTGIYLHTSVATDFDAYFNQGFGPPSGVSKLNYSNETLSYPGNNIVSDTGQKFSTSSSYYGYFAGGTGALNTISRLDFSNETVSNPGNNLLSGRGMGAVTSSLSYGYAYFAGGEIVPTPITYTADIDKLDFSTETLTDLGINLPGNATGRMGYSSSKNHGYYFGGNQNPGDFSVSYIRKLDFSTETFVPQSNISANRSHMTLLSGNATQRWRKFKGFKTYGYYTGGLKFPTAFNYNTSSFERIDFSTENVSVITAKLSVAASNMHSMASNYYGYSSGGQGVPSTIQYCNMTRFNFSSETADRIADCPFFVRDVVPLSNSKYGYIYSLNTTNILRFDYSSETFAFPSTKSLTNRYGSSSGEYGSYGYIVAGGYRSSIERLDFHNDIVTEISSTIYGELYGSATAKNNSYMYCAGGTPNGSLQDSRVVRLNFATETTSLPGNNISPARYDVVGTSSNYYGYFAGGYGPSYQNTINRLDFSSETISNPGKNLSLLNSKMGTFENSN